MNEWKELKVDNLPSDLLTGIYEFQFYNADRWDKATNWNYPELQGVQLQKLIEGTRKYRYRVPPLTLTEKASHWLRDYMCSGKYEVGRSVSTDMIEGFIAGYKAKEEELS